MLRFTALFTLSWYDKLTEIIFHSDRCLLQSQLQPSQYYSHPALTRYFDHIQTSPSVRKTADSLTPAFSLLSFDLDHAPKSKRNVEPPKKKERKADNVVEQAAGKDNGKATASTVEGKNETTIPKEKKEAKKDVDGKKATGSGKTATSAEDAGEPMPSMIDLRVGHIVESKSIDSRFSSSYPSCCTVKKHPDADGLYVEVRFDKYKNPIILTLDMQQIDLGEETGTRTVVSGLVNYIPIEDLRDKYLVAIVDLSAFATILP